MIIRLFEEVIENTELGLEFLVGDERWLNLKTDNITFPYFCALYWNTGNVSRYFAPTLASTFNVSLVLGRTGARLDETPSEKEMFYEDVLLPYAYRIIHELTEKKKYGKVIYYQDNGLPDNISFVKEYNAFDSNCDILVLSFAIKLVPSLDFCPIN